ncbi:MAG: polymer-forming cytoskeletal protein [Hyphomicrobiaceae bacterium]|nr:polymer-forming cytoskeletal protein [Hyphomicrobiaceae bacterium]
MFTRKPDREDEKPAPLERAEPEKPAEALPADTSSAAPLKLTTPLKGTSQVAPSIIGEDLTVEGNVISKGEVQLEGEIKGDVRCASLVIGDRALVEGNLGADDVIVRGRVIGSVRGHRVTLQSNSHVEGDVFHQSLAIEQGAYFEGKSRRSEEPLADMKLAAKNKDKDRSRSDTGSETRSTDAHSDKSGSDNSQKPTRAAE